MRSNLLRVFVWRSSAVSTRIYALLNWSIVAILVAMSTGAFAQQAPSTAPPEAPPSIELRPGRPTSRNDTVYMYRPGSPARMPGCPADTECAPQARATRVPQ